MNYRLLVILLSLISVTAIAQTVCFKADISNAETDEGIFQRARKALETLSMEYADCNIIVVTHGQFARNLLAAHEECSYHDIPQYANAEIRLLNL